MGFETLFEGLAVVTLSLFGRCFSPVFMKSAHAGVTAPTVGEVLNVMGRWPKVERRNQGMTVTPRVSKSSSSKVNVTSMPSRSMRTLLVQSV